jgi:adenine-specific DNA methylase
VIPKECKRLADVDFPIAVVSKHAAREKSIRHGHPSTLHLWWARRPLAACRAMLLGLLLADPADAHCPPEFKAKARALLSKSTGLIQRTLFPTGGEDAPTPIKGRKRRGGPAVSDESLRRHRGATTLDYVHAAMLLQSSGRANALRALVKPETERGPDFLRLANALSALYPRDSDEKRLLDAMLRAVPR